MEVYWLQSAKQNFAGYSIILPSVSLANVGQLAVDLLISTLQTQQVAIVQHTALLPIVGSGWQDGREVGLTTAADLHVCHQHKLLLLQIRSPTARGRRKEFVTALCDFTASLVTSHNDSSGGSDCSSELVVLAGCQAASRADRQMIGTQLRYYTSKLVQPQTSCIESLRALGIPPLEEEKKEGGNMEPFLPGAGFVKDLLDKSAVPSVALLLFVDEGDNTSDAVQLASVVYRWKVPQQTSENTDCVDIKWRFPSSWRNMFGAPTPHSLYL